MLALITLLALAAIAFIYFRHFKRPTWIKPNDEFPPRWRAILSQKVNYYHHLSAEEKTQFEYRVQEFLLNCKVTGIEVEVDINDKLLVASSAIIPIFRFPEWRYNNLKEVLLYPSMFNEKLETSGDNRSILGMVGTGFMEGKMILSKPALHHGFSNASDKKNTAIHEFVHLIDKMDGAIDGIPSLLLENQYAIPWLNLINQKIEEIYTHKSDINPYGGTNKQEFFAVASEYFFERPKLLNQKHPELYKLLEEIFQQHLSTINLTKTRTRSGRNSPCPCGSGLKYKKCCGRAA
ncbi:zinc-dependent peptidase [Saccharicrinis sp. GN24d3]|uniref:zinc-dependent peptidase n=1 Tax=Saccharicrinis sp. GN24d3 TaxID=3458416 RepID=UPI0040370D85